MTFLQSAILGKPMQTRSGHVAIFVAYIKGIPAPLVVRVIGVNEMAGSEYVNEGIYNYNSNGNYLGDHEHPLDLRIFEYSNAFKMEYTGEKRARSCPI